MKTQHSIINDKYITCETHVNKVHKSHIGGEIIRNSEKYIVQDNNTLENLTLSKTTLHTNQETGGHFHEEQEEIYTFISGKGTMQVGDSVFEVKAGDVVLIPKGEWHQVKNWSSVNPLIFVCVFEKYKRGEEQT